MKDVECEIKILKSHVHKTWNLSLKKEYYIKVKSLNLMKSKIYSFKQVFLLWIL